MAEDTLRYSDADLAEFKELIINKIQKAQADLELSQQRADVIANYIVSKFLKY